MDSRNGSLRWLALVGGLLLMTVPVSAQQTTRRDTASRGAPHLVGQPATGVATAAASTAAAVEPAAAQPMQAADTGQTHVVRKGDTLWDLARHYLNDPFKWPRIFQANRSIIQNPHWIFPAQKLVIPGLPPMASSSSAVVTGVSVAPAGAAPAQPAQPKQPAQAKSPSSNAFFGPQKVKHTRFFPGSQDATATAPPVHYPPVSPAEYRSAAWLAPRSAVKPVGTMMRLDDPGTATSPGGSPRYVHPHDEIYIRPAKGQTVAKGDQLVLVRPDRKEGHWGTIWLPTAVVQVVGTQRGVVIASVAHQFANVQSGDLALPVPQAPSFGADTAQAVLNGPQGTLLAFLSSKPLHAIEDEGFVDMGRNKGLRPGDELEAYMPGRVAGPTADHLPSEAIAKMRVVRVTDRTATVRVIALSEPMLRAGLTVRVYKKMP